MEINYTAPDFNNENELFVLAKIHESAPLNWNPHYVIEEKRLENWVKFFKSNSKNENIKFIIAKDKSKIIGFHWIEIVEKYGSQCAHICSLWVDKNYREQGIGAKIKVLGEEWAKERNAEFIFTEVFYDNKKMIDYNLRLGFKTRQVEMIKELKD